MQLKFESYWTTEVGRVWIEAMQVILGHLDLIL